MTLIRPDSPGKPEKKAGNRSELNAAMQQGLPIGTFYKLLDKRIYVHTQKKIIALCALRSQHGKELKLYEWEWRGEEKGWKVALANFRIGNVNLEQVAKDARLFAVEYDIDLEWV